MRVAMVIIIDIKQQISRMNDTLGVHLIAGINFSSVCILGGERVNLLSLKGLSSSHL